MSDTNAAISGGNMPTGGQFNTKNNMVAAPQLKRVTSKDCQECAKIAQYLVQPLQLITSY
jgi:hypothetical protein